MADPHPSGRAGVGPGPFVNVMPPFPPQQYRQGTPPPPLYPSSSHNPSAPQGFSGPGQIHQQPPQQHYQNFDPRFPAPRPWTRYGFHGPPPSYGPQVPVQGCTPGPPSQIYPGMTTVAQITSGPPGTGVGHLRTSMGVSTSHNVIELTSLGQSTPRPPGVGVGHLRTSNAVQSSQDIPGVTSPCQSNWISNVGPQKNGPAQVWNSAPGALPLPIPKVGGPSAAPLSSANGERAPTYSGSRWHEDDQSVNVVEQAISHSWKEKNVDLKELILQIRSLVSQVELATEKIGSIVMAEPSSEEFPTVACPFDPAHMIAPEGLFHHYLNCPSNSNPPSDAQSLLASLHYRNAVQGQSASDSSTRRIDGNGNKLAEPHSASVSTSKSECDIWGGQFYYDGASAVVQAPLHTVHAAPTSFPPSPVREVPKRLRAELETTDAVDPNLCEETSVPGCAQILLPSRFLFLSREIETWKGLPSRCSSLVIEAATHLGDVRKSVIVNWLLVNSPVHGIVLDSTLACHIYSIAKACFQEVIQQASALLDRAEYKQVAVNTSVSPKDTEHVQAAETSLSKISEHERTANVQTVPYKTGSSSVLKSFCPKVQLLDCAKVFRSMDWLSAQLCPLYGSSQSKVFSVNLLKHSLTSSGRLLSSRVMDTYDNRKCASTRNNVEHEGKEVKGVSKNLEIERADSHPSEPAVGSDDGPSNELVGGRESNSQKLDTKAAIAAVIERAVLERYLRTPLHSNRLPKFQLIQAYEAAVQLAKEERMKRPDYRPVLEYDGLIWHRSQLEEKNKNKTREEILAEERDYKRRRMSYRGKKLKRTPTQVVRDIIEAHMEEIVATGGIGSFVKQSGQLQTASTLISKDERSVGSIASTLTDAEQLRLLTSNSSPAGRTTPSSDVNEKGRGRHEQSQGLSDTYKSNEGFRRFSNAKNISEIEGFVDREAAEEQYQCKTHHKILDVGSRRNSKSRTRGEDSEHIVHDGGMYTSKNHRSTSEDHRESSRVGDEASEHRPSSHDHHQTEGLAINRHGKNDRDTRESRTHADDKDYKQRRGDRHDAREEQSRGTRSYERYEDDKDLNEERGRRHRDRSEGRKGDTTSDRYESEGERRGTWRSRH